VGRRAGGSLGASPSGPEGLEPYYAAAERLIGVAGEAGANPFASWRADPYPMPPGPHMYGALLTSAAAAETGRPPRVGGGGPAPSPMPPGPDIYGALPPGAAAEELGYHPYRAPTGVNSVEY